MRTVPLSFDYKGARSYIHSTDIYEAVVSEVTKAGLGTPDGPITINVRKMAHNQLDLYIRDPADQVSRPANASADFLLAADGRDVSGWLIESDRPVSRSIPYDEASLRDRARIRDRSIRFDGETSFLAIEVIASLATLLNDTLIPPGARKWVLTKLDLARPLRAEDGNGLAITLTRNFNDMMTRSELSIRGERVGMLTFSLASHDRM